MPAKHDLCELMPVTSHLLQNRPLVIYSITFYSKPQWKDKLEQIW